MKKGEFDYYIYIDYSENLIGYIIIEKKNVREILSKISKLHHYKDIKHKREYFHSIKKRFERDRLISYLYQYRIDSLWYNADIFTEIIKFIEEHSNFNIFISIDDFQFDNFLKLFKIINDSKNIFLLKESKLKRHSNEEKISLIIDNLLNIHRKKKHEKK
jgi:hypothetical protein